MINIILIGRSDMVGALRTGATWTTESRCARTAWVSHFGVIVLVLIYAFGGVSSISYEGDLLLAQIALFLGWHTALN